MATGPVELEMLSNPQTILDRLFAFQRTVRDMILRTRKESGLNEIGWSSAADTIYKIDTEVDPILEEFCEEWGRSSPIVVVAEGMEDEEGNEVVSRVFPASAKESEAGLRLIFDPIDGTRGIMYDKRPAWALAGVAPNKGPGTRLRDIEIAVMTELPTSKSGFADVLWAVKGQGAKGIRADLRSEETEPLAIGPSKAETINHGFASITNFFPGTKVVAGELMEEIALKMIGPVDVTKATVFEDQYISTGGQFYELMVGHDRFNADLRPLFYRIQGQPEGLCCHPYDCATMLIAEEAGIILTDGLGRPLDGPLDVTTGISWAAFANVKLRDAIEPVLTRYLEGRLQGPGAPSKLGA
jgi:fructose-1,6-bisphosphatase/inositol monophosphatase family enzyme